MTLLESLTLPPDHPVRKAVKVEWNETSVDYTAHPAEVIVLAERRQQQKDLGHAATVASQKTA